MNSGVLVFRIMPAKFQFNSNLFYFFAVSPPKNTPTSTLKSEVSANPLASMAISVKDLQSVQLRKTEKVGKTMSAPIAGEISFT